MKVRDLLLIGVISALGGCITEQPKPILKVECKEEMKQYADRVVYRDFSKINFDSIPVQKVKIPDSLECNLKYSVWHKHQMSDKSKLRRIALEQANSLGYDIEKIKKLSIREFIIMCADIVAKRLEYREDVDDKKGEFAAKYGYRLPIEEYLEIGLGDCNKYAAGMVWIFDTLKEMNQNLENVYMGYKDWGGNWNWTNHDWNSIVFLTKDGIILTNIDPTRYDAYGILEGKRGEHISENDLEILAFFYRGIGDFDRSYNVFGELLFETNDVKKKADIFSQLAYNAYQAKDSQKMRDVREGFTKLGTERQLDDILYWSLKFEERKGNLEEADKFKQELIHRFPNSFWAKNFK